MKLSLIVGSLAVLVAMPAAAAPLVPFDVQMPLVLKALTYDRTLKARAGDQVRIAILIPPKSGRGRADELQASIDGLPDRTVAGLPVTFKELTVDGAAIDQAFGDGRWAAMYVLPGYTREELVEIKRICERRRVLAVAASADEVERGLAFGIGAQSGKPEIIVNLAVSKACGSDFDLALLRLARVIQ